MTTERTLLFPVSDETLKEIHPQWIFIRKAAMEGDVIGLQNEIKAMARVAL